MPQPQDPQPIPPEFGKIVSAIAPQDIHTVRAALTVFDGQVAYRSDI